MGVLLGYGNPNEIKRIYLVYNSRVLPRLDTSDGNVLSPCLTLNEAKSEVRRYFPDGVVFSYHDNGTHLWDERFEWAFFMEDNESWQEMKQKPLKARAWQTCWINQHPGQMVLIQETLRNLLSWKLKISI